MEEIINKIKKKKPLDRLDDDFIKEYIEDFFKRNAKLFNKFKKNELKKKDLEIIIKSVRNELNKVYGQFWISDKLNLESHKSTRERLKIFKQIYSFIFLITGKPKNILDLACGLNPLTYNYLDKDIYFIVNEISDYDCDRLKKYFKENDISGEIIKADLRTYNKFPSADVCFMFKILDSVDVKGHKTAEKLLTTIDSRYIIASFSTENFRGRKMKHPRRVWFEVMLNRLNYNFIKKEFDNEVFYVIDKK